MTKRIPVPLPLRHLTGDSIMQDLIKLVASKYTWTRNKEYLFHQDDETKTVIKITPIPTKKQPGNGIVSFLQVDGRFVPPRYRDLSFQNTVLNPDFQLAYKRWSSKKLMQANFQDISEQANFMIRFEQIRRMNPASGNFLSRSQIQSGINTVMRASPENYPDMVSFKIFKNCLCQLHE